MRRFAKLGVRAFGVTVLVLAASVLAPAQAQTVIVLDAPDTEVRDAFVRGGSYASAVFDTGVLVTKANSNASYTRRAFLRFDTENLVPASATIQSATLTLTLRRSESDTRTVGAYRVTSSFEEAAATWYRRTTSANWGTAGGDLGSRYAQATVGTTPGLRVTFNVTSLVQETVNGTFGSRYTRIALRDFGASSASSYKEFYSSEAADPATRPQLVVTYGSSAPASSPTTTLKVLHWNTHYGIGYYDGVYNIDRIATWVASVQPDIVSLNEVEKYVSGHGNDNQPARYAAMLQARTGQTWYYHFAQRYGDWSSNGGGNLILSRFPIGATANLEMNCDRSAGLATITVNGRNVTVVSTHLDSQTSSCRVSEIAEILPWMRGFSSPRLRRRLQRQPRQFDPVADLGGVRGRLARGYSARHGGGLPGQHARRRHPHLPDRLHPPRARFGGAGGAVGEGLRCARRQRRPHVGSQTADGHLRRAVAHRSDAMHSQAPLLIRK